MAHEAGTTGTNGRTLKAAPLRCDRVASVAATRCQLNSASGIWHILSEKLPPSLQEGK